LGLTKSNNREDVFKDKMDYKKYIEILKRYREKYKFKLYYYVYGKADPLIDEHPIYKGL
jgi:hypothetical protein